MARSFVGTAAAALLIVGIVAGPPLATKAWREFRHPAALGPANDPAARLTSLGGVRYFYWRAAVDAFRRYGH